MMNRESSHQSPRRQFLKAGLATAAGMATDASFQTTEANAKEKPQRSLTIAGYPYERVRALQDGRVGLSGCQVKFIPSKIGELNKHVFNGPQTHDIAEVGLIPYLLAFCNDNFSDYVPLPIFVLKVFRHKSIFVHKDRGIKKPADLRDRKVATVGYSSSGLTWIRGILRDEYDIKPEEINWVVTSKDSAAEQTGGASRWENVLPANLKITRAPKGQDESTLLLNGQVDAIFHPAEPKAYVERHPKVVRLFPDVRKVERAYFKKTGIFPIMHIVTIKRKLAEAEPLLPKAVFQAYSKAKRLDYEEMRKIRWAYSALPWYGQEYEETRKVMGEDFYSYGLKKNRTAIETACRYLHEQGLAKRLLKVKELFDKSMLVFEEA